MPRFPRSPLSPLRPASPGGPGRPISPCIVNIKRSSTLREIIRAGTTGEWERKEIRQSTLNECKHVLRHGETANIKQKDRERAGESKQKRERKKDIDK